MMGLGRIVEQFAETDDAKVIANRNAALSASVTGVMPDNLAACDSGTCTISGNVCCVCGGQAGKHTYYGAKSCSGEQ